MASKYGMLKLGGSDFHGLEKDEQELGSVGLPTPVILEFLQLLSETWNKSHVTMDPQVDDL